MYLCNGIKPVSNMCKILTFFILFVVLGPISFGQIPLLPKIHLEASETAVVNNMNNELSPIDEGHHRNTNYNPSVYLGDSVVTLAYDSLRTDKTATIITVYETDDDSIVGLWQIGTGANRSLWLNSQYASYEDFGFKYRTSTEHGVIIHTMQYQYPNTDSSYNGHDTIFLGREGVHNGEKNLCALLYFPQGLNYRLQQQLESSLAIRYGALLHGPYVNRFMDTLWNPIGRDSLFGHGVCGIGRDDSLSLYQPRSIIRGGILTIKAGSMLSNLDYVMMGCDTGSIALGNEIIVDDTVSYAAFSRHWKLRAHTGHDTISVRLTANLPFPPSAIRIRVASTDGTVILAPSTTDSSMAITLANGQEYYVSLLVDPAALTNGAKGYGNATESNTIAQLIGKYGENRHLDSMFVQLSPNPTSGQYTLHIDQPQDIVNIRVVDSYGRTVDQYTTTEPLSQHIYDGHLTNDGIYYVTVKSNGKQKTIKLIVVR